MTDEQITAQLRHAYYMLIEGVVLNQQSFAEHFISPLIVSLENKMKQKRLKSMHEAILEEL